MKLTYSLQCLLALVLFSKTILFYFFISPSAILQMLYMNFSDVQIILMQHKEELRELGLRRVGVFGSVLHGDMTAVSDVDLLLEFEPEKKTYKNFFQSTLCLESLLNRRVDAVTPEGLSPHIGPRIMDTVSYVQITG